MKIINHTGIIIILAISFLALKETNGFNGAVAVFLILIAARLIKIDVKNN